MQSLSVPDPMVWLLVSYLLGTLACVGWTLLVQTIRSITSRNLREPVR